MFETTHPSSTRKGVLQWGGGVSNGKNKTAVIITVLIVFALACLVCVGSGAAFSGGSGTSSSPYKITTAAELQSMKDYLSSYFILMNDIDCSSLGTSWTPIGASSNFTGNLNGNGKTIRNLTISKSSTQYSGFIGRGGSGMNIHDVTFENCTASLYRSSGLVCGYCTGSGTRTFSNVTVSNCTITAGSYYVGGFVGYVSSSSTVTCSNCKFVNSKVSAGSNGVGGFVGDVDSSSTFSASGCVVDGALVESTGSATVGGFVGYVYSSSISMVSGSPSVSNCYIAGSSYVGGFVGYVISSSTSYVCSVSGGVVSGCTLKSTSTSNGYIGGMLGWTSGSSYYNLQNCQVKNVEIICAVNNVGGMVGFHNA